MKGDPYGAPLPLAAVAKPEEPEPLPPLVWALSPYSVRVHVAVRDEERTLCDMAIAETRDGLGPNYLFCTSCRSLTLGWLPKSIVEHRQFATLTPGTGLR